MFIDLRLFVTVSFPIAVKLTKMIHIQHIYITYAPQSQDIDIFFRVKLFVLYKYVE